MRMKKHLFTGVALLFGAAAFSQKLKADRVPAAVKAALKTAHPAATANWEREDANFEANFQEGGRAVSCIITPAGAITETETILPRTELPQSVQLYITQHLAGKKIRETARIIRADGTTVYEVVAGRKEYLFDAAGTLTDAKKEKD